MKNAKFVITSDIEMANDMLNRGLEPVGIVDGAWYFLAPAYFDFSEFEKSKMAFTNIMPQ